MGEFQKILVVDDERHSVHSIRKFLREHAYKIVTAATGDEGIEKVKNSNPALIIVDVHMVGLDGVDFIRELRSFDTETPLIITTSDADMKIILECISFGAQDYIIKPFQIEELFEKLNYILSKISTKEDDKLLSHLFNKYSISEKLSDLVNLSDVLDLTFETSLRSIDGDNGYIMLLDKEGEKLSLERVKGEYHGSEISHLNISDEWSEAKWVLKNNRSIILEDGVPVGSVILPFTSQTMGTTLIAPIRAGDHAIGVICITYAKKDIISDDTKLNLIELIGAEAGSKINDAGLFKSLNQRITDLGFISDYAEQFVGIVDPEHVIDSFIDTVRHNFEIDFVGVLLVNRRFHDFHYWSHFAFNHDAQDEITKEVVECYNSTSDDNINEKRVRWSPVTSDEESDVFSGEFEFTRVIPLVWGEFKFGAFILKWEHSSNQIEDNIKLLRGIINQTRIALTNAKLFSDIKENYLRTIKALAIAVDAKDTYTHGHSENVMRYSEILANYIKLSSEEVDVIRDGGLLHDIGKIGIPGYILNKPGPLTDDEFNGVMKTHPTLGANIIKEVPFLNELNPIILYHHENYDGTGYPLGLKGDEIPIGAQIVHVADAFEAMTSNRPYRKSLGVKEAIIRLRSACNSQFKPVLVEQFIASMIDANEIVAEEAIVK
jgi:putative nucleotidyltransferase with HDIG domain